MIIFEDGNGSRLEVVAHADGGHIIDIIDDDEGQAAGVYVSPANRRLLIEALRGIVDYGSERA